VPRTTSSSDLGSMPVRSTSALIAMASEIIGPDADQLSLVGEVERGAGETCDNGPGHVCLPFEAAMMVIILKAQGAAEVKSRGVERFPLAIPRRLRRVEATPVGAHASARSSRHAKAAANSDTGEDFDRPLAARGREDAVVGKALAAAGADPQLVLVSSAKRTRETWALVAPRFSSREG